MFRQTVVCGHESVHTCTVSEGHSVAGLGWYQGLGQGHLQSKGPLFALGQGTDEAGAGDGILAQPLPIHALVDA